MARATEQPLPPPPPAPRPTNKAVYVVFASMLAFGIYLAVTPADPWDITDEEDDAAFQEFMKKYEQQQKDYKG